MADPLSVAGLAAGLISLSLQVTTGITQYLDALKCRAEELESVRTYNQSIRNAIVVIEASVVKRQSQHHASSQVVVDSIQQCNAKIKSLEDLVAELAGCNTGNWRSILEVKGRKLRYAFDRSKVQRLAGKLCQAKDMLGTALQVLGVDVSMSALDKMTDIETVTRDTSTDLLATRSELASLHPPLAILDDRLQTVGGRLDHFDSSLTTNTQAISSHVLDGTRLIREDVQVTQTLLSESSSRQTIQLEQIVDQSAAHGKQLQNIVELLEKISQPADSRPANPMQMVHRLVQKPCEMREICDDLGGPSRLQTASFSPLHRNDPTKRATRVRSTTSLHSSGSDVYPVCICRKTNCGTTQTMVKLGDFVWYKTSIRRGHWTSCPLASFVVDEHHRELKLTYNGLARMISSAIEMSFSLSFGAGGWSMAPNIQYRPTVDEKLDPVFRVLHLLDDLLSEGEDLLATDGLPQFVFECQARVLWLFLEKKSTPFATNSLNETVLHQLANIANDVCPWNTAGTEDILSRFWEALTALGVPVNSYCLTGDSPLGRVRASNHSLFLSLYEISREAETELCAPWIESSYLRTGHIRRTESILEAFKKVPGIAEIYGCGPLSLAVLSNQIDRIKCLIDRFPETLNERNLLGHTPLHLAIINPDCLMLLLKAIPRSSEVLNLLDYDHQSPLAIAIKDSRISRRQSSGADCSVSMLLGADCSVSNLNYYDMRYSPNCVMSKFASHLANRRSRLNTFASEFRMIIEGEGIPLEFDEMLDGRAEEVERILTKHGVVVPPSLRTQPPFLSEDLETDLYREQREKGGMNYCSIYAVISSVHDAELFWELGFRGLNSQNPNRKISPLAFMTISWSLTNDAYVSWLLDHGANPLQPFPMIKYPYFYKTTQVVPPKDIGITCAHAMLHSKAQRLWGYLLGRKEFEMEHVKGLKDLNTRFLHLVSPDKCNCACSIRGCTIQIQQLKSLVSLHNVRYHRVWGIRDLTCLTDSISWFYENVAATVPDEFHKDAIRFLTFTALGATHTCCHFIFSTFWTTVPQDDIESIQEEEEAILELLESLLVDFEREVSAIPEIQPFEVARFVDFWRGYWFPKMRDVLADIDTNKLPEETMSKTEELGVVWYGPEMEEVTTVQKYDDWNSWQYWWDELDKIVARKEVE